MTDNEQHNLAKARIAANFTSKGDSDKIILLSTSTTTNAKSSDNRHKQPAAKSDAFTCINKIKIFINKAKVQYQTTLESLTMTPRGRGMMCKCNISH